MSSEEFFSLTPRQLNELMSRHDRAIIDQEVLFAQVASNIVNFSMVRPKEPSKVADFMPSEWVKRSIARSRRLTDAEREEIANRVRSVAKSFLKDQEDDGKQVHHRIVGR